MKPKRAYGTQLVCDLKDKGQVAHERTSFVNLAHAQNLSLHPLPPQQSEAYNSNKGVRPLNRLLNFIDLLCLGKAFRYARRRRVDRWK